MIESKQINWALRQTAFIDAECSKIYINMYACIIRVCAHVYMCVYVFVHVHKNTKIFRKCHLNNHFKDFNDAISIYSVAISLDILATTAGTVLLPACFIGSWSAFTPFNWAIFTWFCRNPFHISPLDNTQAFVTPVKFQPL